MPNNSIHVHRRQTVRNNTHHQKHYWRKLALKWSYSSESSGGSWQPYSAHRDCWTEQKTKNNNNNNNRKWEVWWLGGGVWRRRRLCTILSERQGTGVDCLRPSKAKDGWYCRPVRLFHCYWSVWSPHSRRRRKSPDGWFLEGCGRKPCDVQSRAFGGSRQLCCRSGTGCLRHGEERLAVTPFSFKYILSVVISTANVEKGAHVLSY